MKKNRLGVLFSVFALCTVLLLNAAGTSLYLLNDFVSISISELENAASESNNEDSRWFAVENHSAPCYLAEIEEIEVKDMDDFSSDLIVLPKELADPSYLSKFSSTLDIAPFSKGSKIYLLYHSLKLDC